MNIVNNPAHPIGSQREIGIYNLCVVFSHAYGWAYIKSVKNEKKQHRTTGASIEIGI